MYHEMKNHLIAIQSGLLKESIDITNAYIQKCLEEVGSGGNRTITGTL
jgi:hypothetical protein